MKTTTFFTTPDNRWASSKLPVFWVLALLLTLITAIQVRAQTFGPAYTGLTYSNLGKVSTVPLKYGGLTFKYDDKNTLLIGGGANYPGGAIYAVPVIRGAGGHITGFGVTTYFANTTEPEGGSIDGGLDYGPNNVLFYSTYSGAGSGYIGQIKPGVSGSGTGPGKQIRESSLPGWRQTPKPAAPNTTREGDESTGALIFVPPGFPGAGRLKIGSWIDGVFYDASLSPDGSGTYNITINSALVTGQDIEGMVYVKGGCNAAFPTDAILIGSYIEGIVYAYDIDAIGNPVLATKRVFMTGISEYEGATIDPITGDFLFADWATPGKLIRVNNTTCALCLAGTTAPALSNTSPTNICPATTVDLSSITASNTPAGNTLTWHSGTPATTANKLSAITALAAGTYYAAFFDATNNCYSGTGSATTQVTASVVACTSPSAGVIDCAKTQIMPAPVAGTASQVDLIVTVNVTAIGSFALTVSGSGMTLANGMTSVSTTRLGIQTFHIPLNYDGTALGTLSFTVGSAGSCSADLTKTPKKAIVDTWTLDCVSTAGPTLK